MKLILLAVCFLFVLCPPLQKHGGRDRQKPCEQFTKGYDSTGNRDDWVSQFPADQQHRVLVCLDRLETQRGK